MQELAGDIRTTLDMVTHQLLTAGGPCVPCLHVYLPLLSATAETLKSYSTRQEFDTVANAPPDAGKGYIALQAPSMFTGSG